MSENIRFKDLIAEGLAGAKSNTKFYLDVERYRRAEGWKKDGFKEWEEALRKLIAKIRRSRSGVLAKLAQVRLLLETKKVTFEQLEKIGDANSTLLCRLYRAGKLNAAWIKRALTWEVERFKKAVLKCVKPNEEPKRVFSARLDQSMYVAWMSLVGRIQTLAKINNKEGVLEFMTADYAAKEDAEILHTASLPAVQALVSAQSSTSEKKVTKSRRSKGGSRSPVSISKRARKNSSRSESELTSTDLETSSAANQDGESDSSNAVPEQTTHAAS